MFKSITVLSIERYQDYLFAIHELSVHDTINLKIDHVLQFLIVFIVFVRQT